MITLVQNNLLEIVSGITVLIVAAVASGSYKQFRDWQGRNKIYNYLKTSATTGYRFRSTEAISADVKLTQSQVERLCTSHPKIRRNTAQKQSWQLVD